ncbi:MAG: polynucleotide adenylyltransferase PcnB [Pseudomonadales bacterium]
MTRPSATPRRISAREHGLPRDRVDHNALDVVHVLSAAGYEAMLVGGCVRDLLLGLSPKDFDVATNATPEEVKALFRRSRLVGRRFRIAHVRYGRHIIEVSTFRKAEAEEDDERRHADSGLILRDNVWGTMAEDAFRRDFTINALYYDPENEEIVDYVDGLDDLESGHLRIIGEPDLRLREDPVRILRAVRFRAKLGFSLEPAIEAALPEAAELLEAIPPARLFDEVCKLLVSGYSLAAWQYLAPTPLRKALFPCTPSDDPLVQRAMGNTDQRIAEDKPVTPGFLLAVLLWHDYCARASDLAASHKPADARALAMAETLAAQQLIMSIPRRFSQFVRDVWTLQERLCDTRPRQIARTAEHERFRAAYDFLLLRAETGDPDPMVAERAEWWTRYQEVDAAERGDMIEALRAQGGAAKTGKRRRRRRRKPAGERQALPDPNG